MNRYSAFPPPRAASALAATLWAAALAFPAAAQEADVVTGRVRDAEGNPVAGARVEVIEVESEISRSVLTNAQGRYLLLFPDGTGRYVLRVTSFGMADAVEVVFREADEELLVTDVTLTPRPIPLAGLIVTADRPAPAGGAGEQSTELPAELLERLPLPDLDPTTLALLAAGVTRTAVDSLTGRPGYSIGGMGAELNQVTLDGVVIGPDGVAVPEAGIRQTQVTTSTFDASRGGFAGGEVAMTSARGGNRSSGSLTWRLDDDALQLQASPTTNAFTRYHLGGSWGGPIVSNRLHYNGSFQLQRNVNHRFALAADDPLAAQRSGVSVDSIARFIDLLERDWGVLPPGQTGPYRQLSDELRLQGRLDWTITEGGRTGQSLSARANLSLDDQDSTRINTVDLGEHGGDQARNSRQLALNLTSRFGGGWTNELKLSASHNWSESVPYVELPQGQVRVTSDFEDGTRGTRSLVFGGNRSMPSDAESGELQLSEDLSFILPVGDQIHRLKVGASLQRSRSSTRSTEDLFGTFVFGSLADFAANRPERYERALMERETQSGRSTVAVYVGDTWRVSRPLEVSLGLRWDRSSITERPAHNPLIEQRFGRRTDIEPAAGGWSPRLGFNWRLNGRGEEARALSGGVGWFAGRAPTQVFTTALRQTGLPGGERRLVCVESAAPLPDWGLYLRDASALPLACADGAVPGSPLASRAPTVTLVDPAQSLPSSLRLDLAYRTQLPRDFEGKFRYQYSRGSGLWTHFDLNLDPARGFTLADEGRTFFGSPDAVVSRSGAVSQVGSRLHPELGSVYDVTSRGRSRSHQLMAELEGMLTEEIWLSLNYTLGWARDQGGDSFGRRTTAGDPNRLEWGTAGDDRRHSLKVMLNRALTSWVDLTASATLESGTPFTPMVDRDVNGDGERNDRAFVHDPASIGSDPAVGAAMERLLDAVPNRVPSRVRDCLRRQVGTIAARNSCRDGWSQSLDLAASLRPVLPTLGRRMTVSVDVNNVLTGLDQLVHGADRMRGWGEGQRADATLLEVKGFDPARRAFVYDVNEAFGQARRGPNAFRNAFALSVSAKVALGTQRGENRGFDAAQRGEDPNLAAVLASATRADAPSGVALLDRLLANPIPVLLELPGLTLSPEQATQLRALSAGLQEKLDRRRADLGRQLDGVAASDQARRLAGLAPELELARREVMEALGAVRRVLTPEQWERVPERVREPFVNPAAPATR